MERPRPQITLGELVDFTSKFPRDTKIFVSPSVVNVDEPVETQEFILDEEGKKVVALEYGAERFTIGYDEG